MSAPQRGGRGRGRGRGGNIGGSRSANASEDESGARGAARRGRGNAFANGVTRGINKTLQQRANGQATPRGPKSTTPNSRGRVGAAAGGLTSARISTGSGKGSAEERLNKLKNSRDTERANAIRNGYLADPDKPRSLKDAITMVGTCQDMCPEFERLKRITQKDEWGAETVTTIGEDGQPKRTVDEARMIKQFRRSAAGVDEQLPSDLRPPPVLRRTVDYLFNDLINEAESLVTIQHFIWDRTRAVRNDFSIQQLTKTPDIRLAIECYEHIARYHILSLHQVGTLTKEEAGDRYNHQQDREQFDKTLLSLLRYYNDVRDRYRSPNEAEFRAYWIIFQVQNVTSDLEDQVQSWPTDLINDPRVQRALNIYAAACEVIDAKGPFDRNLRAKIPIAQQNWGRFWKLVGSKQVSYLLSCVAEIHFNTIRRIVLHTILSACQSGGGRKTEDWTLKDVTHMLAFDSVEETQDFVEHYGIDVAKKEDGKAFLDLSSIQGRSLQAPSAELPPQYFSWGLIERKRYARSYPAIIRGMSVKAAREASMIDDNWESEHPIPDKKEEPLFVTGDTDDEETAVKAPGKPQLNPGASPFQLPAQTSSTPTAGFGGFGQPSSKPSFSSGGFGQPSFSTTAMPQPATAFTQNPFASTFTKPGFSFTGSVPGPAINGSAATTAPAATTPSVFDSKPTTDQEKPGFGKPSTANPFSQTNGSSTKQLSVFDFGKNTLQSSQPVNSSKPSPFGNSTGGFGFPSSQGEAGKENEPPKIPQVQVIPPSENGSPAPVPAPVSQSLFEFGLPNGTSSSSTPVSAPPNTSEPVKFTPSTSFTGFQTALNSSAPNNTSDQPTFAWPTTTNEPSQPSTIQVAPSRTTQGLPVASPFGKVEILPKPSEAVQKPQTSSAPAFPSLAPAKTAPAPFSSNGKNVSPALTLPGPPNTRARESAAWDYMARQLLLNPTEGILKQYMEHIAAPIVKEAMRKYEEEKDQEDADGFRWYVLAHRYFTFWKRNVAAMRARRLGRERRVRLAAEKEAHARRVKEKEAQKKVDEARKKAEEKSVDQELDIFRRNLEAGRQTSQPKLDLGYGLIGQPQQSLTNGVSLLPPKMGSINGNGSQSSREGRTSVRAHKRSHTQPNVSTMLPPNNSNHRISRASKQTSPTPSNTSTRSNRSSLLGASILSGASLLDSLGLPHGTKMSTMKSSYFTLKALGLQPPTSYPEPYSVRTGKKRARGSDEYAASTVSIIEDSPPGRKKRFTPRDPISFSSPIRNEASELRTNAVPSSPLNALASSQTRKVLPEDEALFARLRLVTQAMDESTAFFKEEIAKEDLRKSQNGSSHGSSPPNVRFNGSSDTRPRSTEQASPPNNNLPKFYSRPSRFLPREEYGKRREKKPDSPSDSGKGMSRAGAPNGMTNGRSSAMAPPRQRPSRPPPPTQQKKSASDVIDLDSD